MKKKCDIKTSEDFRIVVDNYFNTLLPVQMYNDEGEAIIDKNGVPLMSEKRPATISGLALYMGFNNKSDFKQLLKSKTLSSEFKTALLRIEAYTEELLFDKTTQSGAKFLLQNDFGWGGDFDDKEDEQKKKEKAVVVLARVNEEQTL